MCKHCLAIHVLCVSCQTNSQHLIVFFSCMALCPHEDLSAVTSLTDEFKWARHNMNVVSHAGIIDHVDSLASFLAQSHSSAFSGVGSDLVAQNIWHAEVETHHNGCIPIGEYTAAIEWNNHAADELVALPHGPTCIYQDVMDFAVPAVRTCAYAAIANGAQ